MLQWRLDPTLPPLQHKSAQRRLGDCERREKSSQISQLIAGVSERGERERERLSVACSSVRQGCDTPTHSTVTTRGPHPGNYTWPLSFNCSRPVGIYMRYRSAHEPFALYCWLFLKWQSLSSNSVAEHGIRSMFNRQVTDRDVIGKAASNEPVKHSHRAIIRGLQLGPAPLTL